MNNQYFDPIRGWTFSMTPAPSKIRTDMIASWLAVAAVISIVIAIGSAIGGRDRQAPQEPQGAGQAQETHQAAPAAECRLHGAVGYPTPAKAHCQ